MEAKTFVRQTQENSKIQHTDEPFGAFARESHYHRQGAFQSLPCFLLMVIEGMRLMMFRVSIFVFVDGCMLQYTGTVARGMAWHGMVCVWESSTHSTKMDPKPSNNDQ